MTSNGRVARLTALALATGTLVAANATGATAAATNNDVFTAGNAAGNGVIHLELNLPVSLPGIGNQLTQDLVVTNSAVRTGQSPAAIASAILGQNGNIPLLSSLLAGTSTATLASPNGQTKSGLPILGNTLGLGGLLNLSSTVANPNVDGVISHSASSVANLKIDGANVLNAILKPVLDQLDTVLGSLAASSSSSNASTGVDTVTSVVNTLLGTIDAATSNTTKPVSDAAKAALATVTDLLKGLLTTLKTNLDGLTADGSLLQVGLIQSEQTVTRHLGTVTSSVSNELAHVSVLGGLIGVDGLVSSATASLDKDGNPTATPTANGYLLKGNLADILTAKITNQIQAVLGGSAGGIIPAALLTQVNALLAQVLDLVKNLLGVQFAPPVASNSVAKHNDASQEVSAATLIVNPLQSATAPLLKISFVPAAAQVLRSESVAPPTAVVPNSPPTTTASLPRTGANLPLTGAIATGLVGLAMVARRRRNAHLAG